jgi:RNA polymerase sigma-70 factor (ECF subfamily)
METTSELVRRAAAGDSAALEAIIKRYFPALMRIAHGRLPQGARGLMETGDIVQATVVRALAHLGTFQAEREGAFLAYLRTILLNQIRDVARQFSRRPGEVPLADDLPSFQDGPLEQIIGRERLDLYEKALKRLPKRQREALIMRLEFGSAYEDVAVATGFRTANAARMAVGRAMKRMATVMREIESTSSTRLRAARARRRLS